MSALAQILELDETPRFAVLDGAQFDDLPRDLAAAGLKARALYLNRDGTDDQVVAVGPHMVALESPAQAQAVQGLVGDKPALVVWTCPDGAEALYRHLRGINKVEFPHGADPDPTPDYARIDPRDGPNPPEPPAPRPDPETGQRYDLVNFRHADANAMAQVLPAIDLPTWARLFGPATQIAYLPTDDWGDGGAYVAPRPEDLPQARAGWLRLDLATNARMREIRLDRASRRIARYLRKQAPGNTQGLDDDALVQRARAYVDEAVGYGVQTEGAMGRWAYMQICSGDALSKSVDVHEAMTIRDPGFSADDRVRALMRMSAQGQGGSV